MLYLTKGRGKSKAVVGVLRGIGWGYHGHLRPSLSLMDWSLQHISKRALSTSSSSLLSYSHAFTDMAAPLFTHTSHCFPSQRKSHYPLWRIVQWCPRGRRIEWARHRMHSFSRLCSFDCFSSFHGDRGNWCGRISLSPLPHPSPHLVTAILLAFLNIKFRLFFFFFHRCCLDQYRMIRALTWRWRYSSHIFVDYLLWRNNFRRNIKWTLGFGHIAFPCSGEWERERRNESLYHIMIILLITFHVLCISFSCLIIHPVDKGWVEWNGTASFSISLRRHHRKTSFHIWWYWILRSNSIVPPHFESWHIKMATGCCNFIKKMNVSPGESEAHRTFSHGIFFIFSSNLQIPPFPSHLFFLLPHLPNLVFTLTPLYYLRRKICLTHHNLLSRLSRHFFMMASLPHRRRLSLLLFLI